jgi:hypothetical protein
MKPLSMYPEEETMRQGQVEVEYTGGCAVIRLFTQTDEEAGGRGKDRRAMLMRLEGTTYKYNNVYGTYQDVGSCSKAPREYAVKTILIREPDGMIYVYGGDVDSDIVIGDHDENDREVQ